jgi:hypothetical protein
VSRGEVKETGTPAELIEKYQADSLETAFVKIIGESALLEAAIEEAKKK